MRREDDRKEEQGRSQAGSQWVGSTQLPWPNPGPHLLFRVLEGDHQHHVPSLELQLVCVSSSVVVLGLHLQRVGRARHPFPQSPFVPPATLQSGPGLRVVLV